MKIEIILLTILLGIISCTSTPTNKQDGGCADSNWDSDLFIIEDYKAIRIGNISGIGCEGTGKTGIFISKVNHKKKELIQEILREPGYYEDKFDFIKDYWTKNHERFK